MDAPLDGTWISRSMKPVRIVFLYCPVKSPVANLVIILLVFPPWPLPTTITFNRSIGSPDQTRAPVVQPQLPILSNSSFLRGVTGDNRTAPTIRLERVTIWMSTSSAVLPTVWFCLAHTLLVYRFQQMIQCCRPSVPWSGFGFSLGLARSLALGLFGSSGVPVLFGTSSVSFFFAFAGCSTLSDCLSSCMVPGSNATRTRTAWLWLAFPAANATWARQPRSASSRSVRHRTVTLLTASHVGWHPFFLETLPAATAGTPHATDTTNLLS